MAAAKRSKAPDMSRNMDLAGQTVSKDGYNITYNDQGYATSASNYNHPMVQGTSEGVAARSADAVLSGGARSGGSSSDRDYMSDKDLSTINALRAEYQAAQKAGDSEGMRYAHSQAEALRGKYGYSGGTDGSGYNRLSIKQWNPDGGGSSGGVYSSGGGRSSGGGPVGSFSYGNAPQYVNRYQSQIDDLTAQILGREAFSYDPETDPSYQQYKESYTRGGQRAMQDTLAQLAARTGGLASSYAGSAAQQTYDNYMAALSDKIPELRQLAYSMYQDEGNSLRDNLSMLASLEQGEYGKFADQLGQYNTDRNFNYGMYRDTLGDQRYTNEWNYQVGRDQLSDQRYNTELEYQQALAKAQNLAAIGDFSGYRALGYSDDEIANLTNAYNAAQLLAQQSTRRSGGSSGGNRGGGKPSMTLSQAQKAIENGQVTDAVIYAYDYYMGDGAYEQFYGGNTGGISAGSLSSFKGNGTFAGGLLAGGLNSLFGRSGGGDLTVDMASVLGLGYGPISEDRLAELEAAGEIESYEDGNKIKFRKR